MIKHEEDGLERSIRQQETTTEKEMTPKSFDQIRQELGELKVEKRALRIKVTEEERTREEEIKILLGEYRMQIDQFLDSSEPLHQDDLPMLLRCFSTSAKIIHEARMAGLFELYELAEFDDTLVIQYDRMKQEKGEDLDEGQEELQVFEQEMSKEFLLRELEQLYNTTTSQIRNLYEKLTEATSEVVGGCAEGLCQCANDLFNFEVGGVLRVDEFVGYVTVLRENHAALLKLAAGLEISLSERFTTLIQEVEQMIRKHESNLEDVRKLLEGGENIMSFERYNELAIELAASYKYYIEWQRQMVKESHAESVAAVQAGEISKDKANWSGMGTTIGGRRFQIGLRGKKGCEYGRCASCCLFHGSADASITAENIVTQFDQALKDEGLQAKEGQEKPAWEREADDDVYRIDFNGSGSFLNDSEMPREARVAIFERLAKLPFTSVLIESRVEYITEEKIRELQTCLRPDQKIEVAIGLESANNLVRELAVTKGYSLEDFEKSVEMLAKCDVNVLVYSIVKPALLKESEALEDTLYTGRYLSDLVQRVREQTQNKKFALTMKLEQSFIQKGGYLDFLHETKREGAEGSTTSMYETPWSFTIAEIVQRLCDEKVSEMIHLQIGRSDDFPPPVDVTRNRTKEGGEHEESTKAIDEILQEFNRDGDVEKLSTRLEEVATTYPDVFEAWQETLAK